MKGIITLCGSTKFKKYFEEMNRILTFNNFVVLSVGSYHHSEPNNTIKQEIISYKKQLDKLHKEKIALSKAIVVIDVNGYIGKSTKSEIKHAKHLGLQVYYYSNNSFLNLIGEKK